MVAAILRPRPAAERPLAGGVCLQAVAPQSLVSICHCHLVWARCYVKAARCVSKCPAGFRALEQLASHRSCSLTSSSCHQGSCIAGRQVAEGLFHFFSDELSFSSYRLPACELLQVQSCPSEQSTGSLGHQMALSPLCPPRPPRAEAQGAGGVAASVTTGRAVQVRDEGDDRTLRSLVETVRRCVGGFKVRRFSGRRSGLSVRLHS